MQISPRILLAFAFVTTTASAAPLLTQRPAPCTPGVLLVATDESAVSVGPAGRLQARDARAAAVLAELGIASARPLAFLPGAPAVARTRFLELRSTRPDFDPQRAAEALRATGAFRAVCPDYRLSLMVTPNDADLYLQWYVDDGGSADIRLPAAWDVERGDSSVVIAIMDTGIDTGHPDLASKIWHNPGEIPGNGLDDDGDGFVDDTTGWDFGTNDADPNPEYTMDPSGLDVGFHGTFCAGIAGAATDNGEGIAGAAWRCRLMPIKISHPDSGLRVAAITSGFDYAIMKGAKVVSMSFGAAGDPGVPEFFQALVDGANSAGLVCVAAAGNDGDSARTYPAACSGVLSVGATDDTNARASFSNWGDWVKVAAPGALMWSSICRNYVLSDLDQIFYIYFFGWDGERPYMYGDGTSFSCPLTAGVCALVRSRFPSLGPAQVAAHIVATGDAVAYDEPVGVKVNAFRAVSTAPVGVEAAAPPTALRLEIPAPNPSRGEVRFGLALPADGEVRVEVFDVAGRLVRTLASGRWPAGTNAVTWDGRDAQGHPVSAGLYLVRAAGPGGEARRKVVRLDR